MSDQTQCQEILENKLQCSNPVFAFIDDYAICRLHLAFSLNDPTIDRALIIPADSNNEEDLKMMMDTTPIKE